MLNIHVEQRATSSGKMVLLAKLLAKFFNHSQRLFSMVRVLDIFADFLRVNLYEPKGCKALPQALHEMILLTMLIDFHVSALSCCYRLEPEVSFILTAYV